MRKAAQVSYLSRRSDGQARELSLSGLPLTGRIHQIMANIKHTTTLGDILLEAIAGLARHKPTVIMLDKSVHTAANGYRCTDATCPCWGDWTEVDETRDHPHILDAPLHSNRGFTLLK
jgi:hypothetical protein